MLMDYYNSDLSLWPNTIFVQLSFFSNQNIQMFLELEPHASGQSSCKTWVCITCKQQ